MPSIMKFGMNSMTAMLMKLMSRDLEKAVLEPIQREPIFASIKQKMHMFSFIRLRNFLLKSQLSKERSEISMELQMNIKK
jgi:hypothetical protein